MLVYRNFFRNFELDYSGASRSSEAPRTAQTLENSELTRDLARTRKMRYLKYLVLLAICMLSLATASQAQVRVAVGVGGGPGLD